MPDTPALKTPDKVVGGALAVIVIGALGYGLFIALPFLIALAANTIYFVAELAVLCILLMVVLDRNTWSSIYYKWKSISRNIRKAIVREDPIGILSTVIARFDHKLEEIDANIANAEGARRRQDNAIKKTEAQSTQELNLATAAKRMGKSEPEIAQHAAAAERWQQAADGMKPMATLLANMQTGLERARDLCANRLEDLKNQKSVLQVKLEALQDGQKTVKSFKRFFGTNPDLEMQDLAIDEIERQSTEAEAEIDQFMRVMNPILESADLKKSADASAAMDKFNAYLSTDKSVAALPAAPDTTSVIENTREKFGVKR